MHILMDYGRQGGSGKVKKRVGPPALANMMIVAHLLCLYFFFIIITQDTKKA